MRQPIQRILDNMTVRLSWLLVLAAFMLLILALSGLGLYAAEHAGDPAVGRLVRWGVGVVLLAAVVTGGVVLWGVTANVIRPLEHAVRHCERIAGGDLAGAIEARGENEIGRLYASLAQMQEGLCATVSQVRGSSEGIYAGAQKIAGGNQDLSARTEEQASALQETAASMEQLASTVKQNADNARHASQLAGEASHTAAAGGGVVNDVVATMHEIHKSSREVGDIIKVIDSIAFQTNILALNASVEAARAGEQGRGFAVVAGEVRNLAQRSADAAKQIRQLIEVSLSRVDEGTERADRAGSTMGDIVAAVQKVSDIMDEIAAASAEQSSGIDQVNQAVVQMDQVTQQNAELVQQAAGVASEVESQAEALQHAVARFRFDGERMAAIRDEGKRLEAGDSVDSAELARWMPALVGASPDTGRAVTPQGRRRGDSDSEWESF
ncbi:methyl-accepting chemotaxis protein [Halomonas mongoliensis]|uniref:methyl-accepting chemotaxis protein n=1 Tax=Halomonas mongoliensis TaxID=321265 RepID=UPI00403B09EB